ncbi:MAG TPA: hypothetical protein VGS07_01295 [Thermoanaerobaculia bacterium]|jgi:nitrate reductase gamma subunit|nr:hypothetical protein [Thermoanaerobaculia bacterium]
MILADVISVIGVTGILLIAVSAIYQQIQNDRQAKKSSDRVEAAESRAAQQPEKTKPAWDLARVTLEAYFNRNLSQITSIFWFSVVVMVIGFGIIIWSVNQAVQVPGVVVPAAIATFAGLITEFIGATFLFIYRSTIQQAVVYSYTLERINSVGMAMQILDTLPDKAKADDLKSVTKARLVEQLIAQASDLPRNGETLRPKRRIAKSAAKQETPSGVSDL